MSPGLGPDPPRRPVTRGGSCGASEGDVTLAVGNRRSRATRRVRHPALEQLMASVSAPPSVLTRRSPGRTPAARNAAARSVSTASSPGWRLPAVKRCVPNQRDHQAGSYAGRPAAPNRYSALNASRSTSSTPPRPSTPDDQPAATSPTTAASTAPDHDHNQPGSALSPSGGTNTPTASAERRAARTLIFWWPADSAAEVTGLPAAERARQRGRRIGTPAQRCKRRELSRCRNFASRGSRGAGSMIASQPNSSAPAASALA